MMLLRLLSVCRARVTSDTSRPNDVAVRGAARSATISLAAWRMGAPSGAPLRAARTAFFMNAMFAASSAVTTPGRAGINDPGEATICVASLRARSPVIRAPSARGFGVPAPVPSAVTSCAAGASGSRTTGEVSMLSGDTSA